MSRFAAGRKYTRLVHQLSFLPFPQTVNLCLLTPYLIIAVPAEPWKGLDHAVRGGSGPGLSSFCILRMLKKVTLFLSVLKVPS